jgi:HSP20 family protein
MDVMIRRGRRPSWMTPFEREGLGDVFSDRVWPEWQRDMGQEWTPSMDFYEKEGAYYLAAELPGLSKDDISVTVDKGVVTVTGKKITNKTEEGANYYMKECACGSFSRSLRLPAEVEEDEIKATFKDGILTIEMPHKKEPTTKRIEIG